MDKEYEEFKKYIEKIKSEEMDPTKAKEYILKIKRYLDEFIKNCQGEISKEEALEQFLEEYNKELEIRKPSTARIMYGVSQYNACKILLNLSKSNKMKFNNLIKTAKQREKEGGFGTLSNSLNTEEQLIVTLRNALRQKVQLTEKDLQGYLKANKAEYEKVLKFDFIKRIEESIVYLDEYGALDELIEKVNSTLEKMNLSGAKIRKRNPLPDERCDKNGNIIKYDEKGKLRKYSQNGDIINDQEDLFKYEEDLGLMEILDKEYLRNESVENLLLLDLFWKAKQLEERSNIAKAMLTINLADLWPTILNENEETVKALDDTLISNTLKRDRALTYLYGSVDKITTRMKRQYTKFLKDNNLPKKGKIEDDVQIEKVELENLINLSKDVSLESCVVIGKLMEKEFDIKNWGVLKEENYVEGRKELGIYIENPDFRGGILIALPDFMLEQFFQKDDLNLPKFKHPEKIDNAYEEIMSEICLPVTPVFKEYMLRKYFEEPSSELYAKIAGKKVKNKEVREI